MPPFFEAVATGEGVHGLRENPFQVLDFELVVLRQGSEHSFTQPDRETAVVVLTGTVDVRAGQQDFMAVGGRSSVFSGAPSMVYAPRGHAVRVTCPDGPAEIALCSAPSSTDLSPYRVDPDAVTSGAWGRFNTERHYNFLIDDRRPSDRLYLAEVTVTSGNWATYPPHKHERDGDDGEVFQEEMYYYRVDPQDGFGLCALYGGKVGHDEAFVIRNSTAHKMPYGYHTLTAAPGYRVWYLALYAGDAKAAGPSVDPAHRWYLRAETVLDAFSRAHHG